MVIFLKKHFLSEYKPFTFSEDESTVVSIIRGSSISSPIAPPSGYKLLGHVINTDKNLEYYINNEDDIKLKLLPRE